MGPRQLIKNAGAAAQRDAQKSVALVPEIETELRIPQLKCVYIYIFFFIRCASLNTRGQGLGAHGVITKTLSRGLFLSLSGKRVYAVVISDLSFITAAHLQHLSLARSPKLRCCVLVVVDVHSHKVCDQNSVVLVRVVSLLPAQYMHGPLIRYLPRAPRAPTNYLTAPELDECFV
jgi:hypothetical protein